ncbi:MAG TPA: hypothetical protein VNQ90_20445 [Chthoniobacteraceae bacterium]|nr:hypothetical protein [Chthoniobacteraceae bacterium]
MTTSVFPTQSDVLPEPPQPSRSDWRFEKELREWERREVDWQRRTPRKGEISLKEGVALKWEADDPRGLLESAVDRLERFFSSTGLLVGGGYPVTFRLAPLQGPESWRVVVGREGAEVDGEDLEGLRRAVYWIEDQLAGADGPFLKLGACERKPIIRTRLSRCYFGPIQRPPLNRDELADEVDYYPDAYLDRLAADGINGLWLTIRFADVCDTALFPNKGEARRRRLEKLRRTVEKCARYGIRIFPFCIEPRGFGKADHNTPPEGIAENHPELLGGALTIDGIDQHYFCTGSPKAQSYLEEASRSLFEAVPELGGLIMINLGERPTHCYSSLSTFFSNRCPRCAGREPGEVFKEMLEALERGMSAVNPRAELISWLYVPSLEAPGTGMAEEAVRTALEALATKIPAGVTLQLNFESSGKAERYRRYFTVHDYSLAYIGPSSLFEKVADIRMRQGARMGAKLQVGCSHEVATVPFVPVPGHLYRKYAAMQQLSVHGVMQCWYFGNYPSLMTRAAGELSFAQFPESEEAFLTSLARGFWGAGMAATVREAWGHFQAAYAMFPRHLSFSHFGPVHDAIVWPLHLYPVDRMIAPSWKLGYPPSGDRYGELIGQYHTVEEMLEMTGFMCKEWRKGVGKLAPLRGRVPAGSERWREIGVCEALGLQLASAHAFLRFYVLRDRLPEANRAEQKRLLEMMREIVEEEKVRCGELITLCRGDSRLGFHSEAEGYRYHVEKLEWRIGRLEALLRDDFPRVDREVERGAALFPELTGLRPEGRRVEASRVSGREMEEAGRIAFHEPAGVSKMATEGLFWQVAWDDSHLLVRVVVPCLETPAGRVEKVSVSVEPRRLWPGVHYTALRPGRRYSERVGERVESGWTLEAGETQDRWSLLFAIAWEDLGPRNVDPCRLRINVQCFWASGASASWVERKAGVPRTCLGSYHPDNYGWLMLVS